MSHPFRPLFVEVTEVHPQQRRYVGASCLDWSTLEHVLRKYYTQAAIDRTFPKLQTAPQVSAAQSGGDPQA